MISEKLTHIDEQGSAFMVDVSEKPDTKRIAVAKGEIHLKLDTISLIKKGLLKKGDVLGIAKVAGILAGKNTSSLIPLCHAIPIHQINVELEVDEKLPGILITATALTVGKTGVEMEALTAVSVAALTIYDMVKAVEKTGKIQNIRLVQKRGGLSGDVNNEEF